MTPDTVNVLHSIMIQLKLAASRILLAVLVVVLVGCSATPAPTPVGQPISTPTITPLVQFQLAHERMTAAKSFRAHIDVEIAASETKGVAALNVRRAHNGVISVIMTVEGRQQRYEMILQEDHLYMKDENQEWVRYETEEQMEIGVLPLWAVRVASSLDFFGNLLPSERIPWELYNLESLGPETLGSVEANHIEVRSDFQDMWEHIDESQRTKFVLSRALGIEPEEVFRQTESDKMDLWIGDQGYVHQTTMEMVLDRGRSIKWKMRGYDFDENITVQIPTNYKTLTTYGSPDGQTSVSSIEPKKADSAPLAMPDVLLVVPTGNGLVADPALDTTSDADIATDAASAASSPLPPSLSTRVMTRKEIQASLGLGISLYRRNLSGIDLSYASLKGVNLQEANLTGVNFYAADLSRADLRRATLAGADLKRADLRFTDWRGSDLAEVDLSVLDLEGANLADIQLSGADLNRSYLGKATLTKANLEEANLNKAFLGEADLTKADLRGADLSGADLTNADLTVSDLTDANLKGANLTGARLNGTILLGADLTGANFTDASLIGVNLVAADLSSANVEAAFFDKGTSWAKAFCGDVHRCTRSELRERGALLEG